MSFRRTPNLSFPILNQLITFEIRTPNPHIGILYIASVKPLAYQMGWKTRSLWHTTSSNQINHQILLLVVSFAICLWLLERKIKMRVQLKSQKERIKNKKIYLQKEKSRAIIILPLTIYLSIFTLYSKTVRKYKIK